MIQTALVGFGPAGAGLHAPLIGRTAGMELAAVVTRDPERRGQVAREWPDAAVLDSAEEIWADPGRFDLVVVAAPNRVHAALAEASMRAGLPVVVDKPLALSSAEVDGQLAVSRKTGVAFTVFQNRRFDGDFLALRGLLEGGELGEAVRYEARWERFRPDVAGDRWREQAGEGGGLLWDLGSHLIDQVILLFGRPAEVFAQLDRVRENAEVDDDSFVTLRYDGGLTAQLWMSLVVTAPGPRFRVTGTAGVFESVGLDPQELRLRGDEAPDVAARVVGAEGERDVDAAAGDWADFYARVRDAVACGGPMPVAAQEAAGVVEVIEAAHRSAESAQVVRL